MKAKTSEAFTEILVELAKVNAKLDKLLQGQVPSGDAYALSSGSLTDAGVAQEWTDAVRVGKLGTLNIVIEES